MAEMLVSYLAVNPLPGDILVPVPLHRKRLRERGYNQSGLLAKHLGELTLMPVIEDCLIRNSYALPQARTQALTERRRNVSGAFSCRDGRLAGKRVILIDDVATSGATMDACAAAMKSAGAVSVWGLALSREI